MSIRKGIHYLLRAFAELNLPQAELLLVGPVSPEIEPFLHEYAGCYRYVAPQPQSRLSEFYGQSSVSVVMSLEEGMAMVIPQAMACGLPVICTANTGGEDIVRENVDGFIIPIRAVETLKERLFYLYQNPEKCREMGTSARERVACGFSWDDYGDRIFGKYRDIIGE